ncbi:MAG: protein kinase [Gammaproteobacteria bacterium]|nr:protein kinase [Gammaproteobacteria bacterium]
MATAYLAIQESLGRQAVLKVLDTARAKSEQHIERFLDEGRMIAALNHPNIITIYDVAVANDIIYLSMEYVEGGDLKSRMAQVIPPGQSLDILLKIGTALEVAHKKGIVHRDVKPGNILFRRDGAPLLTDFGIAKQLDVDKDLTSTGTFLGSPNYISPEQAEGLDVDGRADIYSLGIIFYEMLTGMKPYQSPSVIDIIVQHKLAPIPRLPPGLEEFQPLLNLMIAKDRNDRFRDATSMNKYIRKLQASAIKALSPVTSPDFDITDPGNVALSSKLSKAPRIKGSWYFLGVLLVIFFGGYGILKVVESSLEIHPIKIKDVPTTAAVEPPAPAEILPSGVAGSGGAPDMANAPDHAAGTAPTGDGPQRPGMLATKSVAPEVINALVWLGRRSLEEYRLTSPPKDNAYYYYSRILEINPNDQIARQGMLDIAERYAYLAEAEIAQNRYEKAEAYINIGLQINPQNKALLQLKSIVENNRGNGFFNNLKELLGWS